MHIHSYRRPYLWWTITAALVGVGPVMLAGCMDESRISGTPEQPTTTPVLAQTAYLDPDVKYYEADIHIAHYGGFRPDAARQYSYHLVRTFSDGVWSTELTHLRAGSRSGGEIARITLTGPGDIAVTKSSGKPLALPDPRAARALLRQANPNDPKTLAAWHRLRPATPAPPMKGTPGAGAFAGPLTHDLIGKAGRAQSLARFSSSAYAERRPGSVGRRRFERAQGPRVIAVEVDTLTGAAVREEIREGGRLVAATDREYRQNGPLALLDREVTTWYSAGAPRERVERRLANIRTERSH